MENTPRNPDEENEESEESEADRLAAYLAGREEREREEEKEEKEPSASENFFRRLTGQEDEPEEKAEEVPEQTAEVAEANDVEAGAEQIDESAEDHQIAELSPEETQHVEQDLAKANQEAAPEVTSEMPPEEQAAETAVADFRDKIISEEKSPDEALSETLADLGVNPETVSEETPEDEEDDPAQSYQPPTPPVVTPSLPTNNTPPTPTTPPTPPPTPPTPPTPPVPPAIPMPGPGPAPWAAPLPPNPFNTPPTPSPAAPNVIPTSNGEYTRANVMGAAMVGGILGYLLGRRRGRIKTESRLLPIQQKLEENVYELQGQLLAKEAIIRKAATEKFFAEKVASGEQVAESGANAPVEAQTLHSPQPERYGKFLMQAEAIAAAAKLEREAKLAKPSRNEKEAYTLGRTELLEISAKIEVNGTTLRHIYETNLIGEQGLRRIIAEHLAGRDIRRVLQIELTQNRDAYERDPVMRTDLDGGSLTGGGASSPELQAMLERAGAAAIPDGALHITSDKTALPTSNIIEEKPAQSRRTLDIAMAMIILFLAGAVAVVLFVK